MPTRTVKVTDLEDETKPAEEPTAEEVVEEEDDDAVEVPEELEDFEPDDSDELWEGGPTFGDLKLWKEEFGDDNVYVSLINPALNKYCIWRTLDRHEYRALVKNLETALQNGVGETEATMNNEEDIAELCVLYPPYNKHDRKGTTAGFPKLIANDVMEQSGFVEVEVRQL